MPSMSLKQLTEQVTDALKRHRSHSILRRAKSAENEGERKAGGDGRHGASSGSPGGGVQPGENESPAPSAALSEAYKLHEQGVISEEELKAVMIKDAAFMEAVEEHAFLDAQFCVSLAFGESWASKRARIQQNSPVGEQRGWDLVSLIVKSNDDLRQEVCAVQLIGLCERIFREASLDLWLEPYTIISTGASSGLVQTLTDSMSLDALKKTPGYVSLRHHFDATYGSAGEKKLREAKMNFLHSLAAYSLVCYILQIKDRHNGNLLITTDGHLVHIDFGFMLGIAPGGRFSIETCPFKLTEEMVDVLGGLESPLFLEFVTQFVMGFLTLQGQCERLMALVEMMTDRSPFPCFQGKDTKYIMQKLRERLAPHLSKYDSVGFCLNLIRQSYGNRGMAQYDHYQYVSQGIAS